MHHIQHQAHPQANLMLSSTWNDNPYVDVGFQGCHHVIRVAALAERTLIDCPLCAGAPAAEDTLVDSVSPFGTTTLPRPLLSPSNNRYPAAAPRASTVDPTLVSRQQLIVGQPQLPAATAHARFAYEAPLRRTHSIPSGCKVAQHGDAFSRAAFDALRLATQLISWGVDVAGRVGAVLAGTPART